MSYTWQYNRMRLVYFLLHDSGYIVHVRLISLADNNKCGTCDLVQTLDCRRIHRTMWVVVYPMPTRIFTNDLRQARTYHRVLACRDEKRVIEPNFIGCFPASGRCPRTDGIYRLLKFG